MSYALVGTKPWVSAAGNLLGPMFGISTIYGVRADPIRDHPSGLALDFMVGGNSDKDSAAKSRGDMLSSYAVANAGALSVRYIIWRRQVWNAQQGWHAYTGNSKQSYNPHIDHVHITFTDSATGNITLVSNPTGMSNTALMSNPLDALSKPLEWITDRGNWVRMGIFAAGAVFIIMGLRLSLAPVQKAVQATAETVAKAL